MKAKALQGLALVGIACLLVGLMVVRLGGSDAGDETAGADGGATAVSQSRAFDAEAPEELGYAEDSDVRTAALDDVAASSAGGAGASGRASMRRGSGPPTGDGTGRIIKTASLGLRVGDGRFQDALRDGRQVAQRYGGFVVSTSVAGSDARRGGFVLRVPVGSFEAALNDLEALGRVTREEVSGQDVTEEFVDLEGRLRNFEAQEAVLLRLMDRAATVEDTIRVQRELSGVQLEIERLRGRLRFLEDQTSLSTISVTVSEQGSGPPRASIIGRAWTRAVDGFLSVISATIVGAGYVLPLMALVALAIILGRRFLARPAA